MVEEGRDHSEIMVLALQLDDVYRKSIPEVSRKQAPARFGWKRGQVAIQEKWACTQRGYIHN
jgi:hypothetical protein